MAKPRFTLDQLVAIHEGLCIDSRIRILNLIAYLQPVCSKDLEAITGFTQSFMGRHLNFIKKRDLLTYQKAFNYHFFSINPKLSEVIEFTLNASKGDKILDRDISRLEQLDKRGKLIGRKPLETVPKSQK